jgi:hypothetical protein
VCDSASEKSASEFLLPETVEHRHWSLVLQQYYRRWLVLEPAVAELVP